MLKIVKLIPKTCRSRPYTTDLDQILKNRGLVFINAEELNKTNGKIKLLPNTKLLSAWFPEKHNLDLEENLFKKFPSTLEDLSLYNFTFGEQNRHLLKLIPKNLSMLTIFHQKDEFLSEIKSILPSNTKICTSKDYIKARFVTVNGSTMIVTEKDKL
jgi:hypothetical protein